MWTDLKNLKPKEEEKRKRYKYFHFIYKRLNYIQKQYYISNRFTHV